MKLLINCQYYENYNVGPDGFNTYGDGEPHWKPKGGHQFEINNFDSDLLFYSEDEVIEVLHKLVESKNNVASRFEFVSHELVFGEPDEINYDEFLSVWNETIAENSL